MYMQNNTFLIVYTDLSCYSMFGFPGVQIVSSVMNVAWHSNSEHHCRSIKWTVMKQNKVHFHVKNVVRALQNAYSSQTTK